RVQYTSAGQINTSAGCGGTDIDHPCYQNTTSTAPEFKYQGSSTTKVFGVFYQPRGAWMLLTGGGTAANLMRTMIVTGALQTSGSASISFSAIATPPTQRIVTLVE